MLRGSYGDSRVKEWGVFDSVAIEALSAVFEHSCLGGRSCLHLYIMKKDDDVSFGVFVQDTR